MYSLVGSTASAATKASEMDDVSDSFGAVRPESCVFKEESLFSAPSMASPLL
jgi:hypothetical protein